MLLVFSILKLPVYFMHFSLKWKIWQIEWNFKKGPHKNTYMYKHGEYQHQNINNKTVTTHRVHVDVIMCVILYLWLLCIIKWSKREDIWIIPIFGVTFGQNGGIWPRGVARIALGGGCKPLYRGGLSFKPPKPPWLRPCDPRGLHVQGYPPSTVMQLILKKYHHVLSWMCMCGYFALSNCPNREVSWIIPIFGVIFGQNMSIWPSCGVHIYKVTSRCFDIYFEEIVSHFMLNVTFLYFVSLKGPKWQKLDFDPPGWQ